MSHIALNSAPARPAWLAATLDWLRQARVAVSLPHQNVEDLTDRQLRAQQTLDVISTEQRGRMGAP